MATETLLAVGEDGKQTKYLLEVFQDGEHWTSTLAKLDDSGRPAEAKVAPRFYGLTHEQARRGTLKVLENQYEEVRTIERG